jgi:CubicO group peptidase (beta-lactamase class C family)
MPIRTAGAIPVRAAGRLRGRSGLLILAALAATWIPSSTTSAQAGVEERLDRVFSAFSADASPGCAVGVERGGRSVASRAYGMAELEHGVANTPGTVFEAGSVAKQFAVAAAVLLAQDGVLSLDDEVRRHVPELPDYGARLTLRHLIHHTSGLRDWGTVVAASGWPRTTRVHTHDHALDVIARQRSLNYEPGAEYSYTNSGYNLLAIIVERASGRSFADFSRERIFEPLGMRDTQWRDDHTRIVQGRATAYARRGGELTILMPFENVHGNGGLLTTVGDLLIWNRNLESGALGGRALIDELHRQAVLTDGRTIAYAGGLMVGEHRGVAEVSHSGATAGYRAFLARYPSEGVSVALLCNTAEASPVALGRAAAELFLEARPSEATPPRRARVSDRELEAFAGTYRSFRTYLPMRIDLADGSLHIGGRTELVPLGGGEFAVGERRFRFERGGENAELVVTDGEGDVERWIRAAPAKSAGSFEELIGIFRSDEAEAEYTTAVEDGRLVMRLRPHVRLSLTPAYEDAFTASNGWLVRFVRGADGDVEAISLGMGRVRDLRFERVR